MKLPLLLLGSVIMLGCASAPKHAQRPTYEVCNGIYWKMVGIDVRTLFAQYHYDDTKLDKLVDDLNNALVKSGTTQRTIFGCMQLNSQQTTCMQSANTFEAISACEHRYESKEHK